MSVKNAFFNWRAVKKRKLGPYIFFKTTEDNIYGCPILVSKDIFNLLRNQIRLSRLNLTSDIVGSLRMCEGALVPINLDRAWPQLWGGLRPLIPLGQGAATLQHPAPPYTFPSPDGTTGNSKSKCSDLQVYLSLKLVDPLGILFR